MSHLDNRFYYNLSIKLGRDLMTSDVKVASDAWARGNSGNCIDKEIVILASQILNEQP